MEDWKRSKSKHIHFENNNSYLIHRHTTGVPLEVLFDSIGMEITKECIIISEKSYCDSELKSFVNEKSYPGNHTKQTPESERTVPD